MKPALGLISLVLLAACHPQPKPDLAAIYNDAAQMIGDHRSPVIVIPGILGSKLEDTRNGTQVWGAFVYGAADADTPEGARLVALPMRKGATLAELRDKVEPTEALDTLELDLAVLRGLKIGAYVDIMKTLAVGRYRDESLAESGAVDYGGLHYTCFQFPYDWRRDISEQAVNLHEVVLAAQSTARIATGADVQPRLDVVAHSMGGLVLRYYLRYGPNPIRPDGSLPDLTWEGADYIRRAFIVGTPNAGSVLSFKQLVDGVKFAPFTPTFRPAVLATMPAIYQLLPRTRHARVIDEETGNPVDLMNPETWIDYGWGLADPDQDAVLRQLLPDVDDAEERRNIALDHLRKILVRTNALFTALDAPASPPAELELHLYAGDAIDTPDVINVDPDGYIAIAGNSAGDGTVTRSSALMDERTGTGYKPTLRSPIAWKNVTFIAAEHLGLTRDPTFSDNILYQLLEAPAAD